MSRSTNLNGRRKRALKKSLAERDGARCWYCAAPFGPDLEGATVDHLIPRRFLPTWRQEALVLACEPCNHAKADRLPQEILRPRFGPGLTLATAGGEA